MSAAASRPHPALTYLVSVTIWEHTGYTPGRCTTYLCRCGRLWSPNHQADEVLAALHAAGWIVSAGPGVPAELARNAGVNR